MGHRQKHGFNTFQIDAKDLQIHKKEVLCLYPIKKVRKILFQFSEITKPAVKIGKNCLYV